MRGALIAAALSLGSCGSAEQPMNDIERFQAEQEKRMEANPCLRREGEAWAHVGWRNCLKFKPAERMHGVWYLGFEESGFVPNVDTVPVTRDLLKRESREFQTFLEVVSFQVLKQLGLPEGDGCTRAIAIEFIGRKSAGPGKETTGFDIGFVDRPYFGWWQQRSRALAVVARQST